MTVGGTVVVLGGTFDPPHYGHLAAAEEARHRLGAAEVLWMPAGDPPHKAQRVVSPAPHRLRMTCLAIEGNPAFQVSEMEVRREGPSYTVDTLATLRSQHPHADLVFLIGSDEFADLARWRQPERIPRLVRLGVMVRSGVAFSTDMVERAIPDVRGRYSLVPVPNLPLSSSDLRDRVRQGLPIRYLVPDGVREYISAQGLYRS